ncbi:MAG TPA: hypothetical protein VND21_09390 [Planctomycetota bacterium]|nr:hypothetical protein [Planctomycetota bacterium]
MTPPATVDRTITEYLDRLRDLLPPERRSEIVREVGSLIDERLEGEAEAGGEATPSPEAVRRALDALGPPGHLAASLTGGGLMVEGTTRRAFGRALAVVFAGHLLLAIVLTVLGSATPLVPGLVGALPRESWAATAFGLLGIFFADAGFLLVLFSLLGQRRAPAILDRLRLSIPGSRRDAALSLALLAAVAALVHVPGLRDRIFAVGSEGGRVALLSGEVLSLLPALDVMLACFAAAAVALLVVGRESPLGVVADGVASLAGVVFCVLLITRSEIVSIPAATGLSEAQARTFADLILRAVTIVALLSALLLAARFVRRVLRLRELMRSR